jgi:hypothetical protein
VPGFAEEVVQVPDHRHQQLLFVLEVIVDEGRGDPGFCCDLLEGCVLEAFASENAHRSRDDLGSPIRLLSRIALSLGPSTLCQMPSVQRSY